MVEGGDTAFVLVAAGLVMLMLPGLALFYGGMVRGKNVLSTLMHNFFPLALVTVLWILVGYSLAFGPDKGGVIGGLDFIGLRTVGADPRSDVGTTIPQLAFMVFQLMFAIITPALISGSVAERMKFSAYCWFIALWALVVYFPITHWVFAPDGWAFKLGAVDFAGGTVVHINAGIAGLVAALVLGRRSGWPRQPILPHNLTLTVLGAGLLWFGWFGFNAGSALAASGLAATAFVTTQTAAAAATFTWVLAEWVKNGKPTTLGAASGAVAGLVAITPCAGFVRPWAALLIGGVAGVICFLAVSLKFRFRYDDSLDVVAVHLVGGLWGSLAVGLFAWAGVNNVDGLFYGNPGQLGKQVVVVLATLAWSGIITFVLLRVIDAVIGLRVTPDDEATGLDLVLHEETGYNLTPVGTMLGGTQEG